MDYRLTILICLVLTGLLFRQAFAAPAITGVSGTVQDGQTVTISGSGFGATGPNVVFFDSFEKGTAGQVVSLATGSADIGEWNELPTSDSESTISSAYALSGGKSMQIDWRPGSGGGPAVYYSNVQNSYFLFSWWQFIPTNRDVPGTNNVDGANWKWFWMGDRHDGWPMGSDYAGQQHYGFNPDGSTYGIQGPVLGHDEGSPARYDCGWYPDDSLFRKGTWMRVTMVMKNAASGGSIWQQEVSSAGHVIQFNVSNIVTAHADDPWNKLFLPGYGRGDSNAVAYYDDVYVATGAGARARVEMGNASTYSASTKLAFITPTSWDISQIKATVRQGVFKGGETVYLFVVDASGNASPGYGPLTLGQSSVGSQTPTPLPAPEAVAPVGLKISPK